MKLRLVVALVAVLSGCGSSATTSYEDVRAATCPSDLRLLDRRGEVLHELRVDPSRRRLRWTPLDEISPALQQAVLLSEDRRFFEHGGVDGLAVASAAWQRVRGGTMRGASTITMQLAAMLDSTVARGAAPRGFREKWRQMLAAWALEKAWSKTHILEAYLNLVSFRGELQGVAAASALLFDKAPHGLAQNESAVLAALIRSPNATGEQLRARAAELLAKVRGGHARDVPSSDVDDVGEALEQAAAPDADDANVYDKDADLGAALAAAIGAPAGTGPRIAAAPHVARDLLDETAMTTCSDRTSTLDAGVQRIAAESLHRHLREIGDRSVRDGAILVADNATGEVLAYVGSSAQLSPSPMVDGVRARRQPGSTLKPFLYALALDRRLVTASTLLEDTPVEIALGNGVFQPQNYDHLFRGLVSVRSALAGSLNVPAVRTLQLVGTDRFADFLRTLGLDGIDRDGDFYGPSLALGSAEVSLWELVAGYRVLAQGGLHGALHLQSDGSGPPARRVLSEAAAFVVGDVLSDRGSRAVTFGLENALATRFWSAVKTGTSKDMRDNWCVGFSQRYTVGVWVGNFSGAPMQDVSGVSGAAPVWRDVMAYLHRNEPSDAPSPPPGLVRAATRSNKPALSFPAAIDDNEWYIAGTEPAASSPRLARMPRIVSPVSGSILALDLDTPPERQRLAFIAENAPAGAQWRLGDAVYGDAASPRLWQPQRGRYVLSLVDAGGSVLAAAQFDVRVPREKAALLVPLAQ